MGFTTTPLAPLARAPVILSAVITDALKKFSVELIEFQHVREDRLVGIPVLLL